MKAFYNQRIVSDEGDSSLFFAKFKKRTGILEENGSITRVQFRALVTESCLLGMSPELSGYIEAVMPLGENKLGNNLVLVYFGKNAKSREPNLNDLKIVKENFEIASQVKTRPVWQILNRAKENGYSVDILKLHESNLERESLINEMTSLYERFGWRRNDVAELMTNPNNIVSVARTESGQIISAGIAEMARIPINSDLLRIVEITEAATLDGYTRQGLYTAVSIKLLIELAKRSRNNEIFGGSADLVFGECNGLSLGVLKAVKTQGRVLICCPHF